MIVEIRHEDDHSLAVYASIPISFEVRAVVDVPAIRHGDSAIPTRAVPTPYDKNYDVVPGNDPAGWVTRFDIRSWIYLATYAGAVRVGGAIVVADPKSVAQLDGRPGVGILWDVRVAPTWRARGVGRMLLNAAEDAARVAGCHALDAATQDINVAACQLYTGGGCALRGTIPAAYPDAPGETQLVWSKQLIEVPCAIRPMIAATDRAPVT